METPPSLWRGPFEECDRDRLPVRTNHNRRNIPDVGCITVNRVIAGEMSGVGHIYYRFLGPGSGIQISTIDLRLGCHITGKVR